MHGPKPVRQRAVPEHGPWPSSIHPVLARVLAARGVLCPEQAELRLRDLLAPDLLGGMTAAVDLLRRAITANWRVLVVGDFDCDGATATAVAVRGLRMLGAQQVAFKVPHRMRHGYGLSAGLVAELEQPLPDLIVTVDNGVSSIEGVALARQRGIRVLVTDHHMPGEQLPDADAMVNPNLRGDGFPSKALAGVGVMFYLLLALRAQMRRDGMFADSVAPDLSVLLDLVALGTVADLVPLDRNNRILVAAGLRRMREGKACAGILALATVAKRDPARLGATDLGFAIGPRINAAGRLEDMAEGIACLLEDDTERAWEIARRLDTINRERRALQTEMTDQALSGLDQGGSGEGSSGQTATPLNGQIGLCVFEPHWHAGVVGLVASKVKERWHRPVVAFAPAQDDPDCPMLRGSARSIAGLHIRDALAEVDARHPGMIERFGGHAMAAGLSLPRDHLAGFAAAFDQVAASRLDATQLQDEWWVDGELGGDVANRDLAEQLEQAGPWGQAFPEPLFHGVFQVVAWRVVGERHLKLDLRTACGAAVSAIEFQGWKDQPPGTQVALVYQLQTDDFRDRRATQLLVRDRRDG